MPRRKRSPESRLSDIADPVAEPNRSDTLRERLVKTGWSAPAARAVAEWNREFFDALAADEPEALEKLLVELDRLGHHPRLMAPIADHPELAGLFAGLLDPEPARAALSRPFLWAARRTLVQSADHDLAAVRSRADTFRWWWIQQPFTGRRSRLRNAVDRLHRDYPDDFPHSAAARKAFGETRPVARRQLAALAFVASFAWGTATATADLIRYARHRPALEGRDGVALAELEAADDWLAGHADRHLLWSPVSRLVLSNSKAKILAPDLRERAETVRRQRSANAAFRDRLTRWAETLDGAKALESLANLRGDLPKRGPEAVSDGLRGEFDRLRGQLEARYRDAKNNADLTDAEHRYYDAITDRRIGDAARTLARMEAPAGRRDPLVRNFRERAVDILATAERRVRLSKADGDWNDVGRDLDRVLADAVVKGLLAPGEHKAIGETREAFKVANDRRLYERLRNQKVKDSAACGAYLDAAWSTGTIRGPMAEYRAYLAKLAGPLKVTVALDRIEWGAKGWDLVADNQVRVYVNDDPSPQVDATGVASGCRTRYPRPSGGH